MGEIVASYRKEAEDLILKNQKLSIENSAQYTEKCPDCGHRPWERSAGGVENDSMYKLTKSVLSKWNVFDFVSVQPMSGPTCVINKQDGHRQCLTSITKSLKVAWTTESIQDLDPEIIKKSRADLAIF